jgi:hypothetical protein
MYRAKGRSSAARISSRPSWSIYHPSSPPTYEEDYLSNIQLFRTSIARRNLPCINNQRGRLEGYSEEESEAAVWALGRDGRPNGSPTSFVLSGLPRVSSI